MYLSPGCKRSALGGSSVVPDGVWPFLRLLSASAADDLLDGGDISALGITGHLMTLPSARGRGTGT